MGTFAVPKETFAMFGFIFLIELAEFLASGVECLSRLGTAASANLKSTGVAVMRRIKIKTTIIIYFVWKSR